MSILGLFGKNSLRRGAAFPDEVALSRGVSQESLDRRKKSLEFLEKKKISYFEMLFTYDSQLAKLKDTEKIVRRLAASLLVIQFACDVCNGNDLEDSKETIMQVLDAYGVREDLLPEEKNLMENPEEEAASRIVWTYESCRALCWALGLSDEDITWPEAPCSGEDMVYMLLQAQSIDKLIQKCHMRPLAEILDMLDLYTRYNWVCVEKRMGSPVKTGNLDEEVVQECRRGLEWLVSEEDNWFAIEMGT